MSRAEKFIHERTQYCSKEIVWNEKDETFHEYKPWIHPDDADRAVEIASEEMIEKACEYLDGLIELLNDHGYELKKERIIDGLKQAMKDE